MEAVTGTDGNSAPASTGPTTFAEAFASDASSASNPSDQSTTPPAAEQPGTGTEASPQQTEDRSPFIPRQRFDEVNTERTTLKEWKERFAWAEQVNQADLQEAIRIAQLSKTDPIAYMQEFVKDLQAHPTYSAQLKSLAAKALAARGQGPQAPQEPQPDLPIQLEDGRVVHLYSAEQQAKREAWLQQQWLNAVDQKIQPIQQTHEQQIAERKAAEQRQQIEHFTTTTYADMATWPGMDDKANQAAVGEYLKGLNVTSDDPREVQLLANEAYRKVVLPKLSQQAQSTLLDNLKTKAAASTSVNPGSAAATTPKRINKFSDLPKEAWG